MPVKPSTNENEYFHKMELELKKKIKEEHNEKLKKEEKRKLKELHHMHCPKCGMGLVEIDYKNIRIDECSGCKGIWLDAGEIDSIRELEKSTFKKLTKLFKIKLS